MMRGVVGRRVLMVLGNNPYPQDSRVYPEATALIAAGYHVTVICPARSGQRWTARLDGVQVYRFPPPRAAQGFLGYVWEYGYTTLALFILSLVAIWHDGFDIVHVANPPDTLVLLSAFYKALGKRIVYDHHDLAPEMYRAVFGARSKRLVYQTLLALEKLSYRYADHVLVTNQSYKTVALRRGRVQEDHVTIVRNGPDLEHLRPMDPDPALRQPGKTIIGYVGVIGFHDGVDYLLRALHHLVSDLGRSDFVCMLVGSGDALPGLVELVKQLGLADYVQFMGWVDGADIGRYLSAADICVAPEPSNAYNDRSTMIKMMEYMAAGKPIVAFDLPEHRATAQMAAMYVHPNDEGAFAHALAQLMDNADARQMMGACGRRRVETTLAWRHSVPNLLHAYCAVTSTQLKRRV